jgi:hypothetical protein
MPYIYLTLMTTFTFAYCFFTPNHGMHGMSLIVSSVLFLLPPAPSPHP